VPTIATIPGGPELQPQFAGNNHSPDTDSIADPAAVSN
jgi:hypothetical protein